METQPEFREKGAFTVVGIERYTANGIPDIRRAWGEFGTRKNEIAHSLGPVAFGVEDYSRDLDMNNGGFPKYYYTAGLEVSTIKGIPIGMVAKTIPAANYAVFTFKGAMSDIHDFFGYIYGEWLPKSGYTMNDKLSLDFERYPEPLMDPDHAHVEIWVPIVKK